MKPPSRLLRCIANPHSFAAYRASKILALAATKAFIITHSPPPPPFSIISLLLSLMLGPNLLAPDPSTLTAPSANNGLLLSNILGRINNTPLVGTTVQVEDAANVRVLALTVFSMAGIGRAWCGMMHLRL